MVYQINDNTIGTQRLAFDANGYTEIGSSSSPGGPLSINGRSLLDTSNTAYLAQSIARSDAMPRTTGAVSVTGGVTVTVGCPASAGFGSCNGPAVICAWNSSKTSFDIAPLFNSGTQTIGYSVF